MENTAFNSFSIIVTGGCPAINRTSFPQERFYGAVAQKGPFIY
jgi:hypothetical protein